MQLDYYELAKALRALSADMVENAGAGHLGLSLGMADVLTVLFHDFLRHDPKQPKWEDRDRFVLSAGHGTPAYYSLLHLLGYPVELDDLRMFRKFGSKTPGHPEYGLTESVEATTGALGQGLGMSVGLALAERLLNARLGNGIINHRTYCLVGDGCLMEGISHEAASLAGHLKLSNLIVLFDDNRTTIDGSTDLTVSDNHLERFSAQGWTVIACDGHDFEAIKDAFRKAQESERPSFLAFKTCIGKGIPGIEGTPRAHGGVIGRENLKKMHDNIGWSEASFQIPKSVSTAWIEAGKAASSKAQIWSEALEPAQRNHLKELFGKEVPAELQSTLNGLKKIMCAEQKACATRFASLQVIESIESLLPGFVGGAADLTVSTFTRAEKSRAVQAGDFSGSHIHYGVREHLMIAALNGLAAHGGVRPYAGTFLPFLDYARPALRTAAMMKLNPIIICSHDSISGGDDGPTHQAVEQIAHLRSTPRTLTLRPADAVETVECWDIAVRNEGRPAVLLFSAHGWPATASGMPPVRNSHTDENLCARGAYILAEAPNHRELTILATGSEVSLAIEARKSLSSKGIETAVISMPSWELFEEQDESYRLHVLGDAPRVAIEAASPFGWSRYVGRDENVISVKDFGASADWITMFEKYDITVSALEELALQVLREADTRSGARE